MSIECDVLVVGGGPAGSSAARAAAKKGAKTILIEEDPEIGKPVQCAEGIGRYLIPFLPFKIPKEQLKWEIKGMTFWADDILIERNGGIWSGYTINRSEWDRWLASLAKNEGAQIKTNSKLIDLEFDDNYIVKKAIIESKDKKIEIKPRMLIAADGVKSTVIDILKIKKEYIDLFADVKSYEIKNLDLIYPRHDQLFIGDFAPNSYSYIFPINKTRANVGVGIYKNKKNIDDMFNEFLEIPIVKKQIRNGTNIIEKDGCAPLRYQTDKWAYGNVLLAGDAANQNFKPFVEGNLPGIICGDIAGRISSINLKEKNNIEDYKIKVKKILGPMFKSSDELLEIMLKNYKNKERNLLNLILASNIYSIKKLKKLVGSDKIEIEKEIYSWKKSKSKQYLSKLVDKYYMSYLFLLRKFRLF